MSLRYYLSEIAAKSDFDSGSYTGDYGGEYNKTINDVRYKFIVDIYPTVKDALRGVNQRWTAEDSVLRIDFMADGEAKLTGQRIPFTIFSYIKGAVGKFLKKRPGRPGERATVGSILVTTEKEKETKRKTAYAALLRQMVKDYDRKITEIRNINLPKDNESGTLYVLDKAV